MLQMIGLSDFLTSEKLLNHINIDYRIYENAGLYDGIEDLSRFLTNKIKSHQEYNFILEYNYDDIQLRNFNNIFFSKIIIKCERNKYNNNYGEYIPNEEIDFNKTINKFNYIRINLSLSIKHIAQEVYRILLHELTHAWDDYNSYKNKTTSLKTVLLNNYNNILKILDTSKNSYDEIIGKILYFLSDIEMNAFMTEIAGYLYDTLDTNTIDNPHKAVEILKNSDLYKNYKNIGSILNSISETSDYEEFKNKLTNTFNEVNNTDYSSDKVLKILINKYIKIMRKIESNIGKLCVRYVKELKVR